MGKLDESTFPVPLVCLSRDPKLRSTVPVSIAARVLYQSWQPIWAVFLPSPVELETPAVSRH
jgi:hypothetical protein